MAKESLSEATREFGERVRARRHELGKSQEQLARESSLELPRPGGAGTAEPHAAQHPQTRRRPRSLDLSVTEFAVLEVLLHASPAFLSAEDLLEKAWDENADPFTGTVAVTISRLRRKLGDPPVITTTPGVGYRIASQTAKDQPSTI